MKQEGKIIIFISLLTIAIMGLAVFFLDRNQSQTAPDQSLLETTESPQLGQAEAAVTVVEFADFQCPYCASQYPSLKSFLGSQPEVRLVFRHYPLPQHQNAVPAALAAQAAKNQGKFWEMADLLFTRQNDWAELASTTEIFENYAQELGLNLEQFRQDRDGSDTLNQIYADKAAGNQLQVNATPTFFINGQLAKNIGNDLFEEITKALPEN